MGDAFSRRDFLKTAGATAGVAIAAGYSPFSYAQNEKLRVACIGTGGQGGFHIRHGLNDTKEIEIVAVCDVYKPHLEAAYNAAGGGDIKMYQDYRKLLDELDFDAAVIATPLHVHFPVAMDCLDAGKPVFCEKTLCYNIEECRALVKKCHETGLLFQVGHQRRYNPEYNKAVWLARGSEVGPSTIGRINLLNAEWNRNNDWRRPVDHSYELSEEEKLWIKDIDRHINWRLYKDYSFGLITELLTHQLDVFNWFMGGMPKRVAGFGGIDYWRDGRDVFDNIKLIYEYDVSRDQGGFAMVPPRNEHQRVSQINRPYSVRATYTSGCANAKDDYFEEIRGDRGTLRTTEMAGCHFFAEPAAKEDWNEREDAASVAEQIVQGESREPSPEAYTTGEKIVVVDNHGERFTEPTAVDRMQFEAFANDIRTGGVPKANQMVGLLVAVAGLKGYEAIVNGTMVDIDPALYSFDFETPDPWRYDFFDDPDYDDLLNAPLESA
jgi:predicted dehydrogenase